jgi:hypothetical protein
VTLAAIKKMALSGGDQLMIQWDVINQDPQYRQDFMNTLSIVAENLPTLESLYSKLTSNLNIMLPDEETMMTAADREFYITRVEDELIATYQLLDIWERFQIIERLTS